MASWLPDPNATDAAIIVCERMIEVPREDRRKPPSKPRQPIGVGGTQRELMKRLEQLLRI